MAFGGTQIILEENYDEDFVPTEKGEGIMTEALGHFLP